MGGLYVRGRAYGGHRAAVIALTPSMDFSGNGAGPPAVLGVCTARAGLIRIQQPVTSQICHPVIPGAILFNGTGQFQNLDLMRDVGPAGLDALPAFCPGTEKSGNGRLDEKQWKDLCSDCRRPHHSRRANIIYNKDRQKDQ